MDAYLAIVSRREVREYLAKPIPPEIEHAILDAGRMSGSAKNRQPWTFVVVRDDRAVEGVAESVYEPGNIRGAAYVVAIHTTGGPAIDAGRAAQNMMLAAWAHEIGSSPNGVNDKVGLNRTLGLDDDANVPIVISFGYPAKRRDPERRSAQEWIDRANRKPFDEVVREI